MQGLSQFIGNEGALALTLFTSVFPFHQAKTVETVFFPSLNYYSRLRRVSLVKTKVRIL